jgi:hypothetical protein
MKLWMGRMQSTGDDRRIVVWAEDGTNARDMVSDRLPQYIGQLFGPVSIKPEITIDVTSGRSQRKATQQVELFIDHPEIPAGVYVEIQPRPVAADWVVEDVSPS